MVLDSTPRYGVGVYEDSKARLKHQTLMQDYEELQKVLFCCGFLFFILFGRSDALFGYLLCGLLLQ